jgi:hypothetical protein
VQQRTLHRWGRRREHRCCNRQSLLCPLHRRRKRYRTAPVPQQIRGAWVETNEKRRRRGRRRFRSFSRNERT